MRARPSGARPDPGTNSCEIAVADEERMSQRITARPAFDPEQLARENERETIPPPPGMPHYSAGASSGTMAVTRPALATSVPTLVVSRDDLEWFDLTIEARALLAQVDGHVCIEVICARAGGTIAEGIAQFDDLARDGIVALG